MKLDVYVNYRGNCKEAFQFYEKHLGGKITGMSTFKDQPDLSNVPKDWEDAILHARIELGGAVLMGADIPHAEPMRSAYLTLSLSSDKEADRIYKLLS